MTERRNDKSNQRLTLKMTESPSVRIVHWPTTAFAVRHSRPPRALVFLLVTRSVSNSSQKHSHWLPFSDSACNWHACLRKSDSVQIMSESSVSCGRSKWNCAGRCDDACDAVLVLLQLACQVPLMRVATVAVCAAYGLQLTQHQQQQQLLWPDPLHICCPIISVRPTCVNQ